MLATAGMLDVVGRPDGPRNGRMRCKTPIAGRHVGAPPSPARMRWQNFHVNFVSGARLRERSKFIENKREGRQDSTGSQSIGRVFLRRNYLASRKL